MQEHADEIENSQRKLKQYDLNLVSHSKDIQLLLRLYESAHFELDRNQILKK